MRIERQELVRQSAQISCLTDDLIKLARKLSSTTSRCLDNAEGAPVVFGFNALLIYYLTKSIAAFQVILEGLLGLVTDPMEPVSADNTVLLQPPLSIIPELTQQN
jgi:hypothetical protein